MNICRKCGNEYTPAERDTNHGHICQPCLRAKNREYYLRYNATKYMDADCGELPPYPEKVVIWDTGKTWVLPGVRS